MKSLRKPRYQGEDKNTKEFADAVIDGFNFLQKIPTNDGVKLLDLDFGTQTETTNQQLNHQLGRKALGVMLLTAKPKSKDGAGYLTSFPTHNYFLDTDDLAFITISADMATAFTFSFWVY